MFWNLSALVLLTEALLYRVEALKNSNNFVLLRIGTYTQNQAKIISYKLEKPTGILFC